MTLFPIITELGRIGANKCDVRVCVTRYGLWPYARTRRYGQRPYAPPGIWNGISGEVQASWRFAEMAALENG